MSDQQTLPPPGRQFTDRPFAYDPVRQPELFDGVIFKRTTAFIIDAIIIALLTVAAYVAVGIPVSLWCFGRAMNIARREGSLLHY
jgi:uncharacterized RDD family membrane protein YckC